MKRKSNVLYDSYIMFKRCLLISLRSPETILTSVATPFLLLFLFSATFGNIADVGDINYVGFIVPGIIMQCIGQATQFCALSVSNDMNKGIIDRFRSMSVTKSSILIAHIATGVVRNSISVIVIIGASFVLGFRPEASFMDWILVIILLCLINITFSLIGVLCGLIAKTPEGAGALMFPFIVLPFFSSGFAPIESLSLSIRWLAEIQPITPMIDGIRSLTLGLPQGNSVWIAFAWCIGIIVVSYIAAIRVYNNKVS